MYIRYILLVIICANFTCMTAATEISREAAEFFQTITTAMSLLKKSKSVGETDWYFGRLLGRMLQSSYLFTRVGKLFNDSSLDPVDADIIRSDAALFHNTVKVNHSYVENYPFPDDPGFLNLKELLYVLFTIENMFKNYFVDQVLTRKRNNRNNYVQFWEYDVARDRRDPMIPLFKLLNQNISVIEMWKDKKLCRLGSVKYVFLDIYAGFLRYFVNYQIAQGILSESQREKCFLIKDFPRKVEDVMLRMIRVLDHCWGEEKREVQQLYLALKRKSDSNVNCPSVLWIVSLFVAIFTTILW